MPFHDSIRVAIEHGTENAEVADYATMAYWYQTEPHAPLPPLPPPDQRQVQAVKIPATAQLAESLGVTRRDAHTEVAVRVPRPDRYEMRVYTLGADGLVRPPHSLGLRRVEQPGPATVVLGPEDSVPAAVDAIPVRIWARDWAGAGPYPNPRVVHSEHSVALDSVYPPERDLHAPGVRWHRVQAGVDGQVRLVPVFHPSDAVAVYGRTVLYSPRAQQVTLLLGADDAHQLWVNGALVSSRQGRHESKPDDLAIAVPLRAGRNAVLLKVANLDGGWAFQLRAADPAGDVRWQAPTR